MVSILCRNFLQINGSLCGIAESKILPISTSLMGMSPVKWISTSPCLLAEPLKKKKRIDPMVIKAREERRKKKLEKQIRRLERNERQMKPIQELEVPVAIIDHYHERIRSNIEVSPDEEESRWLLQKEWSRYMFNVNSHELRMIDKILASQHKALEELRKESEELYEAAIQLDFSYVPCEIKGPVETPPIKDYNNSVAEGDFINISRKWE